MTNNQNKPGGNRIWMIMMGLAIVVLFVIVLWPKADKVTVVQRASNNSDFKPETTSVDNLPVPAVGEDDPFRSSVPKGTIVPGEDAVLSEAESKEIAIPDTVVSAGPGSEAELRIFDIRAENGVFEPKKIIVNFGDTININFTAVDKDYDLTIPSYNMRAIVRKGQTKLIGFSAMYEGSFKYYCQSCGGPDGTAAGQLIVAK